MTDYKLYPIIAPSAPPPEALEEPHSPENPQVAYRLSAIQAKQRGTSCKHFVGCGISDWSNC